MVNTYGLIQNSVVVNTVKAQNADIKDNSYVWVDITNLNPQPGIGWGYNGVIFTAPTPPAPPPPVEAKDAIGEPTVISAFSVDTSARDSFPPVKGMIVFNSDINKLEFYNSSNWVSSLAAQVSVAVIKEIQTSGTQGGAFNSGAWRTRVLNTLNDPSAIVTSLSSNQFVLPAGTYEIQWSAPSWAVDSHKSRLFNITDTAVAFVGSNGNSGNSMDISNGCDIVTIASPKTFEIQHQCQTSNVSNGFGAASGFSTNEVYTQVRISKIG